MAKAGKRVVAFENTPVMTGYWWYWDAYMDLSTCRTVGMSEGPIPWIAIEQYAQTHRLNVAEKWTLHQVVRKVDNKQLDTKNSEREADKPKPSPQVRRFPARGGRGGRRR